MAYEKLDGGKAALLMIDHQKGTIQAVKSIPVDEMTANAELLAKAAGILGMPVVFTTSMENNMQGPLLKGLQKILPQAYQTRIARKGIVNAMDDPDFVAAVEATGRQQIILAGVTNDVCTVLPALSLIAAGYRVFVAADAGGSPTRQGDELALRRMELNGAVVAGTGQFIAELAVDWTSPSGSQLMQAVVA